MVSALAGQHIDSPITERPDRAGNNIAAAVDIDLANRLGTASGLDTNEKGGPVDQLSQLDEIATDALVAAGWHIGRQVGRIHCYPGS